MKLNIGKRRIMTQSVSGVEFGFSSFFKGFLKAVSSNIECKGGNRYSGGTTITIFQLQIGF